MSEKNATNNLASAMIEAQKNMKPLFNSADNPYFKSKYAPLSEVNNSAMPALLNAGIAVFSGTSTKWDGPKPVVYVSIRFVHAATGEEWAEEISMMPDKNTPQAIGSAITYGRRYLMTTMTGLAAMDDDGSEASNGNAAARPHEPQFSMNGVAEIEGGQADEPFDDSHAGATANKPINTKSATFKRFQAVGTELYGKEWETKRHDLAKAISKGKTESSADLTIDQVKQLIIGMENKLQAEIVAA